MNVMAKKNKFDQQTREFKNWHWNTSKNWLGYGGIKQTLDVVYQKNNAKIGCNP